MRTWVVEQHSFPELSLGLFLCLRSDHTAFMQICKCRRTLMQNTAQPFGGYCKKTRLVSINVSRFSLTLTHTIYVYTVVSAQCAPNEDGADTNVAWLLKHCHVIVQTRLHVKLQPKGNLPIHFLGGYHFKFLVEISASCLIQDKNAEVI